MKFDANAKRYWPLIVCAMIGLAAYFQASAIGSLVSASIGGEPHVPELDASGDNTDGPVVDAAPILSRNPFDSSAGPIARPEPEDVEDEEDSGGEGACSTGRVVLIAQNDDPKWAFASIDDGSGKAQLRRVGDTFGNFKLESLTWDRVHLTESGKPCFLTMGNAALVTKSADTDDEPTEKSGDITDDIQKISDGEYTMDRVTMDAILGARGGFLGKTRAEPVREGDAVTGLRLGSVDEGSTLDHLGMESGDVLQSMSGMQITSPAKLLSAYDRLRESDVFRLRILRNGVPKQIQFRIR